MRRTVRVLPALALCAAACAAVPADDTAAGEVSADDGAELAPTRGPLLRASCGAVTPNEIDRVIDDYRTRELLRRNVALAKPGGGTSAIVINTYVHVIHDGPLGLIPTQMIKDQIDVLNAAYAPHGFQFALAPSTASNPNPDFSDNADWYNDQEIAFKTALHEGTADDLNLYTNSGGGYLGYAYYPSNYESSPVRDGVVLAWGTLPGAVQPGISDDPDFVYNLGDTATHEIGHYLGLAHTFEGSCGKFGDSVDDTPSEKSADYYCTEGRNSCKDGKGPVLLDPIHNFMDYSDDVCLTEFTPGQTARMQAQWALYRQGR